MLERRVCEFIGCRKLTRNKGYDKKGRHRWGRVCQYHHIKHLREKNRYGQNRYLIPNDKCQRCGWNKAPCDRHRIDPSIGYLRSNVLVLCPNCHRIETIRQKRKTGQFSVDLLTTCSHCHKPRAFVVNHQKKGSGNSSKKVEILCRRCLYAVYHPGWRPKASPVSRPTFGLVYPNQTIANFD